MAVNEDKIRQALSKALDSLKSEVLAAVKQNPKDGNAVKALSMLTALNPIIRGYIKKLTTKECEGIVKVVTEFLEEIK